MSNLSQRKISVKREKLDRPALSFRDIIVLAGFTDSRILAAAW
jgi:hypothetical protein